MNPFDPFTTEDTGVGSAGGNDQADDTGGGSAGILGTMVTSGG